MSKPTRITRRRAIASIGAVGIAALGGQGALGAQGKEESMATRKLEDPTTKYPKPPFREQSQPWPGLASKMDPRPDHGEKATKALAVYSAEKR